MIITKQESKMRPQGHPADQDPLERLKSIEPNFQDIVSLHQQPLTLIRRQKRKSGWLKSQK